ncbi:hypothetical protein [Acidocella sp.]|jgi:hypothetical protein|uniref:hypothetical protein n=1 Tax=Acidocella sp. TaxID=50710 RepID=UPI002F41BF51
MFKTSSRTRFAWTTLALLGLAGCSEGMEERRPVPVNISQFKPGENRINVVSVVGAPQGSLSDQGDTCDVYKLYTTGLGGFGKGVVTGAEALTDVGTLGLAELIWTPVQAGTQPVPHTVIFCYDKNDKLASITNKVQS